MWGPHPQWWNTLWFRKWMLDYLGKLQVPVVSFLHGALRRSGEHEMFCPFQPHSALPMTAGYELFYACPLSPRVAQACWVGVASSLFPLDPLPSQYHVDSQHSIDCCTILVYCEGGYPCCVYGRTCISHALIALHSETLWISLNTNTMSRLES